MGRKEKERIGEVRRREGEWGREKIGERESMRVREGVVES